MNRLVIILGIVLSMFSFVPRAYSAEGHFWDSVTFTSSAIGAREEVQVQAQLTKSGRPAFEFLNVKVGKDQISVSKDLLKQIDFPNLRSFLLMSSEKEGVRTFLLSVSPTWKGQPHTQPRYTFEISEGKIKSFYKQVGGKNKEILYTGSK